MSRELLIACWPWLAMLLAAVTGARALVWLGGRSDARAWLHLGSLHRDQTGAVQSLSFVLTMPLFVLLMLFVVQVSQVMIAQVVVHYAAFASARSAMVWIPARVATGPEHENHVLSYSDIDDPGRTYRISPAGEKYAKIRAAAVLACAAMAGIARNVPGIVSRDRRAETILAMSSTLDSRVAQNTRLPQRLANKIAYSEAATRVGIEFYHPDQEPYLRPYYEWIDRYGIWHWIEFDDNELGWQDQISVTVTHDFALLPGPARVFARPTSNVDQTAMRIQRRGGVFVLPITATATLGNEGEKSVRPFVHTSAR